MSNKQTLRLQQATAILNTEAPDWQKLLNHVVDSYHCATGTLHFLDTASNLLQVKAHVGVPEFLVPKLATIPMGKGMAGIAAERRAPVEMCNLQTDDSGVARPAAKETKVEGSIAVPLLLNDRLYGVIGVGKQVPYDFTAAESDELLAIGKAIASKLASEKIKTS